jgi:hypothetical protein
MRRVLLLLALALVPTAPAVAAPKDWSDVVDFTGAGNLNRYDPADAALLQVLSPERVRDVGMQTQLQAQLDDLRQRQSVIKRSALRDGATEQQAIKLAVQKTAFRASNVMQGIQTIDPGCQLSSSNPGGYDLCGYYSGGDLMSEWEGGARYQTMWAGLQECDGGGGSCPGNNYWRVWYKSQAGGFSSTNLSHDVDVAQWEKWYVYLEPDHGASGRLGSADPGQLNNCAPCYDTGIWNSYFPDPDTGWWAYGEWFIRDYVHIDGTDNTSGVDNNLASFWWDRPGNTVLCPGPNPDGGPQDNPGC